MKRRWGKAIFMAVIGLWIAFTWLGGSGSSAATVDDAVIRNYVAVFDVSADGTLTATEDLDVFFPTARHGIFRFWDVRDPGDSHARLVPQDVTVSRDGAPETFDLQRESHGRYRVAKIGDPDVLVGSGVHHYQLRYRIDGVLTPGKVWRTQFYWNLVPAGWRMAISQTRLVVHLPTAAQGARCAVGVGSDSGCTARGTDTLRVRTGALAPNTPVTVEAGLDMPTPPRSHVPWAQPLDPWLGSSPALLGAVVVLAGAAGVGGGLASARSREPKPGYPLQYAPPEGLGPAQAVYLYDERVADTGFVASLMHAAEVGAIELTRDGAGWSIRGTADEEAWQRLDEVTRSTLERLTVTHGGSFDVSRSDVTAGQQLQSAMASYKVDTRRWARKQGYVVSTGMGSMGGIVVVLALGAALGLAVWNPLDMAAIALVPALFGLGGLALLAHGSGTRRTASGRELWSRIGGFRRVLATPSSEARFDFSARKELYTAYVPWAVAFGCAEAWAKKYRTEMGVEPPVPAYFGGYTGDHTGAFVGSMVSDFQTTVSSAISSYEATQSSSSSGGGGFSGGGGGGGGGGGSW